MHLTTATLLAAAGAGRVGRVGPTLSAVLGLVAVALGAPVLLRPGQRADRTTLATVLAGAVIATVLGAIGLTLGVVGRRIENATLRAPSPHT